MKNKTSKIFLVIAFFGITLFACSPIVENTQILHPKSIKLIDGRTIKQSFVSYDQGITGFEIFFEPGKPGIGTLDISLINQVNNESVGESYRLINNDIREPGFYKIPISFNPKITPSQLYLVMKYAGDGSINLGISNPESYVDGTIFINEIQRNGQLAFKILRSPFGYFKSFGKTGLLILYSILAFSFLFIPPGLLLLRLIPIDLMIQSKSEFQKFLVKIILSIGLGLSLYPILFAISWQINFQLWQYFAWGLPVISILGLIIIKIIRREFSSPSAKKIFQSLSLLDNLLIVAILTILISRFSIIRNIEIPLWGDSVQHATITQLIIDNGGLFKSWEPYTPYESFSTHFGFSAYAALFGWVTGIESWRSTLIIGQLLNAYAVFSLIPLALILSKGNKWTGLGAIVAAGLLMPTPGIYINWGRYAQLAGQALLPISLCFFWKALESKFNLKVCILAGLTLAGMTLSYYRMPFYYLIFNVGLLIFWAFPLWKFNSNKWFVGLRTALSVSAIGLVLFAFWGTTLFGTKLSDFLIAGINIGSPLSRLINEFQHFSNLFIYITPALTIIFFVGIIWGLVSKTWIILSLPFWIVGLVGYLSGSLIRLPGANMLQVFAILIFLYIPVSLMFGWVIGEAIEYLSNRLKINLLSENKNDRMAVSHKVNYYQNAALFVYVIVIIFGYRYQTGLFDPIKYQMVSYPDLLAMQWIAENTPRESTFLVEGFSINQGKSIVGSDAGWWIPLLGRRRNTMPPQYALYNEFPNPIDYSNHIVNLVTTIEQNEMSSPNVISKICDQAITHIYIGQREGKVGGSGAPLFSREEINQFPEIYKLIYEQTNIRIFEFNHSVCKDE